MNDSEIERWSDGLSGRRPLVPGEDDSLEALRHVIRSTDQAARDEGAADEAGLARLMRKLESEGLVDASPRARRSLWHGPSAWLAAAAAIGVVAIGVRLGVEILSPDGGGEISRGITGTATILSDAPEETAALTMQELGAIGLKPARLPATDRVIIEVVVQGAQVGSFQRWASPHALYVSGPGTYRIFVDHRATTP